MVVWTADWLPARLAPPSPPLSISQILTCGFTPHPPHAKLEKTAFSSVLTVPNRHFNATIDAVSRTHPS